MATEKKILNHCWHNHIIKPILGPKLSLVALNSLDKTVCAILRRFSRLLSELKTRINYKQKELLHRVFLHIYDIYSLGIYQAIP